MASFSVTNAFAFAHANQVCCLLLDRLLLKGRGILFRLLLKDLQGQFALAACFFFMQCVYFLLSSALMPFLLH